MKKETMYLLIAVALAAVAFLFFRKRGGNVVSIGGAAAEPSQEDTLNAFTSAPHTNLSQTVAGSVNQAAAEADYKASYVYIPPLPAVPVSATDAYAAANLAAANPTPENILAAKIAANSYQSTETVLPGYQAPLPSYNGQVNTPIYVGTKTALPLNNLLPGSY